MPCFFPATAETCPGGPGRTETQPFVSTPRQTQEERRTTDEHLDFFAELGWRDMRLDELATDVARRARPALRGFVERVHDAQGMWVCALERAELLVQEDIRL